MKIGIMTQPLLNNYGGLLQAFAMQKYLVNQGHEVLTVDVPFINTKYRVMKSNLKKTLLKKVLHRPLINDHTERFIKENIKRTRHISRVEKLGKLKAYQFDAFVVGSDQVWRPLYSPGIPAYFLEFLGDDDKTRRVSYAASFGVDHCNEFSSELITRCAVLAKKFHAMGVREESGVNLCREHFGVQAEHLIDPTLLLEKEDYIDLINKDGIKKNDGNMMVYVLDKDNEKIDMINKVAEVRNLKPYTIVLGSGDMYPPVTEWLRGFMDAEYVVTDSFHGMAFSIIFNKPFLAIGNHGRGLARFTSFLKIFGLEDRLIFTLKDVNEDIINKEVNYSEINKIKLHEQNRAKTFLIKALMGS